MGEGMHQTQRAIICYSNRWGDDRRPVQVASGVARSNRLHRIVPSRTCRLLSIQMQQKSGCSGTQTSSQEAFSTARIITPLGTIMKPRKMVDPGLAIPDHSKADLISSVPCNIRTIGPARVRGFSNRPLCDVMRGHFSVCHAPSTPPLTNALTRPCLTLL